MSSARFTLARDLDILTWEGRHDVHVLTKETMRSGSANNFKVGMTSASRQGDLVASFLEQGLWQL